MFFAISQKSQVGQSLRTNWLDDAPFIGCLPITHWCFWNHAPPDTTCIHILSLRPFVVIALIAQSCLDSFETPWTVAYQVPLSMGFSRQEYWSWLPFPSPRNLLDPGTEAVSPILAGGFFSTEPRKPRLDPGRMETMTEKKSRVANPKPHPSMQMFSIQKQVFSPTLPHVRVNHPAGSELRRQGGMLFIAPKASRKHSVKTW